MKLLTDTKTFEGKPYYVVTIEDPIWVNRKLWNKMDDWCWDNFGPTNRDRWFTDNRAFWFKNEADRTLFILKWS